MRAEKGEFGAHVALSGDGDTALIGAPRDNSHHGAAWTFTRSGSSWTQQGEKLVGDCTSSCTNQGTGESEEGKFGSERRALGRRRYGADRRLGRQRRLRRGLGIHAFGFDVDEAGRKACRRAPAAAATRAGEPENGSGAWSRSPRRGNTALIGGPADNAAVGAAWVFTRSGSSWTQQGEKLVGDCTGSCTNQGTGETGEGEFAASVALSEDGDTALIGGPADNGGEGAAWVFTRSGAIWTQQGRKAHRRRREGATANSA